MNYKNNTVSVSVIIPCYNCSETIERAVDSVINQTVLPSEIILVDDCSSDEGKTVNKLLHLQTKYGEELIKVIFLLKNGGPSKARNVGWEEASQVYIAFLDADDSWHSQKIEYQYQIMLNNPDLDMTGHIHKLISTVVTNELDNLQDNKQIKIGKFQMLLSNKLSTSSVMLKKDIHHRFDENKRHSEDYLLWLNILMNNFNVMYLMSPLAYAYKPPYGYGGLSKDLWKMEKGELDTYRKIGRLSLSLYIMKYPLMAFSFIKYLRRCIYILVNKLL